MRIQTKPLTYEITNKDKNFKGTEFEKSDFKIVLKEINSIENNEIIKNNTTFKTENGKEVEHIDWNMVHAELLSKAIVELNGFEDEEGNEIIPTAENIKAIALYDGELFSLIFVALADKIKSKKKSMKR